MPYTSTAHWQRHKLQFLTRHEFNSRIESALKTIERKMNGLSFFNLHRLERFNARTNLELAAANRLVCLCVTNAKIREFAPFYLYLANSRALEPPDDAKNAYYSICSELGW